MAVHICLCKKKKKTILLDINYNRIYILKLSLICELSNFHWVMFTI